MIGVRDDGQRFGLGRFGGGAYLGLLDCDRNGMVELQNLNGSTTGRGGEYARLALLERRRCGRGLGLEVAGW